MQVMSQLGTWLGNIGRHPDRHFSSATGLGTRQAWIGGYRDYKSLQQRPRSVHTPVTGLAQPYGASAAWRRAWRFVVQAKPFRQALNLGSDLE